MGRGSALSETFSWPEAVGRAGQQPGISTADAQTIAEMERGPVERDLVVMFASL
jgi:hypothetical protein